MNDWHDLAFYGGTILGGLGLAAFLWRWWLYHQQQQHLRRLASLEALKRVERVRGVPLDKLPIPTKEKLG